MEKAEAVDRTRHTRPFPLWVISGSVDHVDGLHRTQPVYLNKRTRAGPAGWGQPCARDPG
jgi:hypothetical protein